MASGCGISKKLNKKTNTTFLYFWKYKDGKKTEKYIGRADDKEADIKGAKIMLEFYQNQDKELHIIIKNLETKIVLNNTYNKLLTPKSITNMKKLPYYLPDFED